MAMDHFAAVMRRYRAGRSDRQITTEAGIPHHWLSIYTKPSTSIKTMPDDGRIQALARAIGCPYGELRAAFRDDVTGASANAETVPETDPQTKEMLRLWSGLDTHHRGTNIAVLRSLATLQRRTTAIDARDNREVG